MAGRTHHAVLPVASWGARHGVATHVETLVQSLFVWPSLLDRVRGDDRRLASLAQIAASSDVRVVPSLLPLLAISDTLAPHVGRTLADLVREVTPAQLTWLDEQVRHGSLSSYGPSGWQGLAPGAVSRLAQEAGLDTRSIGLIASHANGFVRAAALEVLAQRVDGQEIPFLSLRANDWVEPVAARASELLTSRLRPDNRDAVLLAIPFIVRVLGQHRRDHRGVERALRVVLLSDGGEAALNRGARVDTPTRRMMYALITSGGNASARKIVTAGLSDPDAVIRARAVRSVTADEKRDDRTATLERLLRGDPVPSVRRLALAAVSEHLPDRVAFAFPDVLFDRAASVRGLARFVASTHQLPFVPRDVYIQGLAASLPKRLGAAIDGIGESGVPSDADLVLPFLGAKMPRIRRAALRALAKLDSDRAIPAAVMALGDEASSVRTAAADILSNHANRVDFEIVSRRIRSLADAHARRTLLRVLMAAPKWEAPALLLEALADPDNEVRAVASQLVERWTAHFNRNQTRPSASQLHRITALLDSAALRLPAETVRLLRFSIKPA